MQPRAAYASPVRAPAWADRKGPEWGEWFYRKHSGSAKQWDEPDLA
jgi:hypothetical protein